MILLPVVRSDLLVLFFLPLENNLELSAVPHTKVWLCSKTIRFGCGEGLTAAASGVCRKGVGLLFLLLLIVFLGLSDLSIMP